MKTVLFQFVLFSILLLPTSCSEMLTNKDTLRDISIKTELFSHRQFFELRQINAKLIEKLDQPPSHVLQLFKEIEDSLMNIQQSLIEHCGGIHPKTGSYMHLPAIAHVNHYFYRDDLNQNQRIHTFFHLVAKFVTSYTELNPESPFGEELQSKFEFLSNTADIEPTELFLDLPLDRAMQVIRSLQMSIELEKMRYVLSLQNIN
ncbi:hypothetical protein [Phaeocystidibacter marisrubri]|uniref:Uncharacterized protein n=1 Tax=Phaeocystidibacter marisrubri TaxID=1577780 RepID=A0A6L3ZIX4_9FLAO|nr:hypothetical protein [Phaeocystidibacter marisrubri]KAB2817966.1 hypothetical protein F8C82_06060 [Phaeocystidibacter marisrubri]